jgi:hypothetical protein
MGMSPRDFLPFKLTRDQVKDSGMAFILILLLIGIFSHKDIFIKFGAIALILNMIFPKLFFPFAVLWIGSSRLLGTIVSKFLLAFVFFFIVTPVGVIRKSLGIDSLKIKKFKQGHESVMVLRNKCFTKDDIEKPF